MAFSHPRSRCVKPSWWKWCLGTRAQGWGPLEIRSHKGMAQPCVSGLYQSEAGSQCSKKQPQSQWLKQQRFISCSHYLFSAGRWGGSRQSCSPESQEPRLRDGGLHLEVRAGQSRHKGRQGCLNVCPCCGGKASQPLSTDCARPPPRDPLVFGECRWGDASLPSEDQMNQPYRQFLGERLGGQG